MESKFRIAFMIIAVAGSLILLEAGAVPTRSAVAEEDWDTVVKAAKKEGRVAVVGPRGDTRRRALTETFEKRFGIQVQFLGTGGPELPPRIKTERRVKKYLWDVFIAGTTTLLKGIKPEGALEPIEPALILPEVKDPKYWRGGELPYMDPDKTVLAVLQQAGQYVFVNSQLANPDEFRSWRELLNPKWKGKIVVARDPRVSGYGRSTFQYFYIHKDLGRDFIREFIKQDLNILRNDRTGALWLAQGKYAICICSDLETTRLMEEGLPVRALDPHKIKEGTHVTSAFANIALVNRAPHPNAAKIYFNWVLSREGSTLFTQSTNIPSLRVDVTTEHVENWRIPAKGWPITNTEGAIKVEDELVEFLTQVLK